MKNRKHCTRRMWWWWIKKKVSWLYSTRFFLRVLFIKILNIITLFILFFIIIILFFFYYLSFIYYNYYSTTAIPSLIIGIAKYKYNNKKVKSFTYHSTGSVRPIKEQARARSSSRWFKKKRNFGKLLLGT